MNPDEDKPEEPQAPQATPEPVPAEEPAVETTAEPIEEPLAEEALSTFASEPEQEPALEDAAPEPPPQRAPMPPPLREPPRQARQDTYADADIPMPHTPRRTDQRRARDARANLDLDLNRIKRRKRYGFILTTVTVLFVAFVLAPVLWVAAYLFIDPPGTVLMVQRAAEGETISYHPARITRISPHIVRSVIAAEDANFCSHDGFDVEAIQNAMQSNARGGRVRGASTISQQVAKNVFLWPERSWVRKGFETYFTALIEFMWPKRRIMEMYLNVAEWGDGNFGIEAASRARFGVAAADLTPLQAARLAAVLPSPNRWRADNPGPYVRRRAASIVQRARVVRNEHMAACVLALDRPRS